ncbi:Lactonase, 7-bladed beta-propeller-domain-containing protein [Umbelopsis sp. PMI_123]|jgi:6-phosphogluconolactonase|nr:Lactonase, 7-bladed beta-propeller-domain-containing protein [Umbelopsis sp. PMI_123]
MLVKSLLSIASLAATCLSTVQAVRYIYVGSYGNNISVYTANPHNGNLTLVHQAESLAPSYLALHPNNQYLYAGNELNNTYSAFQVLKDGSLKFINKQNSLGTAPAHVGVHPSGKFVLGTSYDAGTFYTYPIQQNGAIGNANKEFKDPAVNGASLVSLQGHDTPHAHQLIAAVNQTQLLGFDLGIDRINVFTLGSDGSLTLSTEQPFININGGAGPRHGVFSKDGKFLYMVTEEGNFVTVFKYDASLGTFTYVQNIDTLPNSFSNVSYGGEIRISPNGKNIYATNRVPGTVQGSIAVYKINTTTGKLSLIQIIGSAGEYPRGLNIDPEGKFVYSGNQNSNTIGVYKVDTEGKLHLTATVNQPSPVDFEFGPIL